MIQLESVMSLFDATVRTRGAQYAREGRVFLQEVNPDGFCALVKGLRAYDVEFYLTATGVDLNCTCPYFEDRGPCKHLWAALLKAKEAEKHPAEWVREAATIPAEFEEEFAPETLRFHPPAPAPPLNWRTVLHHVREAGALTVPDPGVPQRITYHFLKHATLQDGKVTLAVEGCRPRKNGEGWTKPTPLGISQNDIARLPDETDRRVLAILEGARDETGFSHYYDDTRTASQYILTDALTGIVLPLIAATGRLFFEDTGRDHQTALHVDNAEPWQFRLRVRRDTATQAYVTTGELHRNGITMPLHAPDLLLAQGWMVSGSVLSRLEYGASFGWIAHLRRTPELRVSPAETQEWLPDFLESPRPPTDLPGELEFEIETGIPEPRLSLYHSHVDQRSPMLGAALSFRYGDRHIAAGDPQRTLYDMDSRKACTRHADGEETYRAFLFTLPVRRQTASGDHWFPRPIDALVPAKSLSGIAAALLAQNWHVEIEGVPCKRSSSFSLKVSSGVDWFDLEGHAAFDDETITMPEILRAAQSGTQMIKLGSGALGMLPEEWLKRVGLLASMGHGKDHPLRFAKTQAFLLDALLSQQADVTWDQASKRIRDKLRAFDGIKPGRELESFRGELRAYQREGLGWFEFLRAFGFGGCLADDMGLGKTVQALALLQHRQRNGHGPFLVVAPSSVVSNWMDEARRFVPELACINHTGPNRSTDAQAFGAGDLVMSSYAVLRRDIAWLKDVRFDYVILDEAQAIKNAQTATAKSARLLNAQHRLAMSGTPIENHLGELWSLFEFMNPGMLGSGTAFEKALKAGGLDVEDGTRELLRRAVRPFMLRRTKEKVAPELPEKNEETVFCELAPAQRAIYEELRDYYRRSLKEKVADRGLGKSKIIVLEALLRLRQAACHPALIHAKYGRKPSAKLDLLLQQVEDVTAEGHKVLVFSQFTSFLALVRRRLELRKITHEYLDGRTSNRAARVKRFQEDPKCPVFLISLKAGGVGLNLTAADYVILLDPWWNPAVEAQAIDRTHRIGQTRKVFAYRLVAKDTVEERILDLQAKKRDLADSIIRADSSLIRTLTSNDLEYLLS